MVSCGSQNKNNGGKVKSIVSVSQQDFLPWLSARASRSDGTTCRDPNSGDSHATVATISEKGSHRGSTTQTCAASKLAAARSAAPMFSGILGDTRTTLVLRKTYELWFGIELKRSSCVAARHVKALDLFAFKSKDVVLHCRVKPSCIAFRFIYTATHVLKLIWFFPLQRGGWQRCF